LERELLLDHKEDHAIHKLMKTKGSVPQFFRDVYACEKNQTVFLQNVSCRNSFLKFLEFLYCDKFIETTTPLLVKGASDICKTLGLNNLHILLKKKYEFAKSKIHA
jgi:hypothetical protein